MNIRSFTVPYMTAEIDDLHKRIANTRWPQSLEFDEQDRGIHLSQIQQMATYWAESFNWSAFADRLNALPNFMTEVDGQTLHFLHVKSSHADAIPMILLHGSPGSFLEFLHVIEPLTNPESGQAYHLVIPNHPGFGFSTPAVRPWESMSIARLYAGLMAELGYDRYIAQGGDSGAFIAPDLGRVDADHVIGVHVNAASYGFIPYHDLSEDEVAALSEREQGKYAQLQHYNDDVSWYFNPLARRPQTIGYAMADSPIGLLGWLATMFRDFSDPANTLFNDDRNREIFYANLTLYWLTNSFASMANLYWESMHDWSGIPENSGTPTGVAVFKQDVSMRSFSGYLNTIVHWTDFDEGGHFAALETPDLLMRDISAFVQVCNLKPITSQ